MGAIGSPRLTGVFRPRVLLIAEMCNPYWVSVPLEGWFHSRALSRVADTHLVTAEMNRANLHAEGLREGADFTVIPPTAIEGLAGRVATLLRGGRTVGWTVATAVRSLTYYGFEKRIWQLLGSRIEGGDFDIVHRLTPLSPTAASPMAKWCRHRGVPFVVGPLNGGLPWPPGFESARRGEREWLTPFRGGHRLLPSYRATRENAAAIIAGSRATLAEIPRRFANKCVYIPENGVDPERFTLRTRSEVAPPVGVAFLGRHVRYKGADMLIEAAAELVRAGKVRLDILGGNGPETGRLKEMVQSYGLGEGVEFPGWIDHSLLQDRLARSDVFGFPSVREFGGAAVVEAMALGLVPIVLDYGGPGEIVSPATGFALPMGSRPQVVERLRSTLSRLVDDPSIVGPMGERARRRALDLFTWDAKATQVLEVYDWVLGRSTRKPDFGMPLQDRPAESEPKL